MAGPVTNLRSLDSASFRTSRRADAVNDQMQGRLGLKYRYEPARLAIAHSLALPEPAPRLSDEDAEEPGKTILGRNLFGDDDLPLWVAMIVENAGLLSPSVDDIQEQVRRHWHRGILLLSEEWANCNGEYDRFILYLAELAGLPDHAQRPAKTTDGWEGAAAKVDAVPVTLRLGDPGIDVTTQKPVDWLLNGKGGSPHVALMGSSGVGKTRLAVQMIRQIRQQTAAPVILFDMAKGDLASDRALVQALQAQVIHSPKASVPLDVLHLPDQSLPEVTNAAMRFRESFVRVAKTKPGGVQLDALREAAQRAFYDELPISITNIRDALRVVYNENNRKPDAVTALFNDLTQWRLFEPKMKPADFFHQSWIVDVHDAPETAQRLVIFLILDAMYASFPSLPDSAMDAQGHRAIRLVLGIDEARRVLGYGQPSLISLVRESRSKGVSIFLISQSPDDYDSEEDNFLENVGLAVCFKTNATSSRALRAWLGQNVDLASLPTGVALTRLPGQPGITRVKAWE